MSLASKICTAGHSPLQHLLESEAIKIYKVNWRKFFGSFVELTLRWSHISHASCAFCVVVMLPDSRGCFWLSPAWGVGSYKKSWSGGQRCINSRRVIFCSDSTVDGQFDGKAVDRCWYDVGNLVDFTMILYHPSTWRVFCCHTDGSNWMKCPSRVPCFITLCPPGSNCVGRDFGAARRQQNPQQWDGGRSKTLKESRFTW